MAEARPGGAGGGEEEAFGVGVEVLVGGCVVGLFGVGDVVEEGGGGEEGRVVSGGGMVRGWRLVMGRGLRSLGGGA